MVTKQTYNQFMVSSYTQCTHVLNKMSYEYTAHSISQKYSVSTETSALAARKKIKHF